MATAIEVDSIEADEGSLSATCFDDSLASDGTEDTAADTYILLGSSIETFDGAFPV